MSDIFNIIAGVLLGLLVGIVMLFMYVRFRISQISGNLDNLIKEAIKEVEKEMVGINIEKHNGIFYAYREDDNQFVAQGTTVEELRTAFKTVYPNKVTYLAGGDEEAVKEMKEALEATR